MTTEILMASMGVITLSACYAGWHYAKHAEQVEKMHDGMVEYANKALRENIDLQRERDRLSDLVATLQTKVPARNARGKFVAR